MSAAAPVRRAAGLRWDAAARRYRAPDGRFLSAARVQRILEEQIVATEGRMRGLASDLRDGRINLPEFQIRLERLTKSAILHGAAVEKGGFAQLSRSDLGWIGQRVRTAFAFIRNLADELETEKQDKGRSLAARLGQYARESRATERAMSVRIAKADGRTERRRVVAKADVCRNSVSKRGVERPGCLEQGRLGWRKIDDPALVEIGSATCLRNCRCYWEFRGERERAT